MSPKFDIYVFNTLDLVVCSSFPCFLITPYYLQTLLVFKLDCFGRTQQKKPNTDKYVCLIGSLSSRYYAYEVLKNVTTAGSLK